ncbi:MFS transporter [Ferrithrix thermotolerans]|uniref:MFS transporter n=1 Tax=Ferrithrix thermotolerans TaxID=209649 RepID=UPI00116042AA
MINSITLLSAFIGAIFFGRLADKIGRKRTYVLEAAIMVLVSLLRSLRRNNRLQVFLH